MFIWDGNDTGDGLTYCSTALAPRSLIFYEFWKRKEANGALLFSTPGQDSESGFHGRPGGLANTDSVREAA